MLTEYDSKYIDEKYSYKKLFIVMYCFKYFAEKDKTNMCQVIDTVIEKANSLNKEMFYKSKSNRIAINELDNIVKEVL
jgi:hypothetical protein